MARTCQACGTRKIRSDNESGRCTPCQRACRSVVSCVACDRKLDVRSKNGRLCRKCLTIVARRFAEKLAGADTSAGRALFDAAVAFSQRRYSGTRAAAFTSALLAFGATSARTLLTEEDPNHKE